MAELPGQTPWSERPAITGKEKAQVIIIIIVIFYYCVKNGCHFWRVREI